MKKRLVKSLDQAEKERAKKTRSKGIFGTPEKERIIPKVASLPKKKDDGLSQKNDDYSNSSMEAMSVTDTLPPKYDKKDTKEITNFMYNVALRNGKSQAASESWASAVIFKFRKIGIYTVQ